MKYTSTVHQIGLEFEAPGDEWELHSVHYERSSVVVIWKAVKG
jgi:hypothetical protein